ncbi:unnamed protein product [Hydatigera taeniaeformis]|uniref:DUF4880 domain-containing protein n=1 Tax=Hydatigena taeniaeformis TaxID=6205 RepID=A0A0R3WWX5_HYDTA|nr:unnamed protein product [Hydatigera taeniaeformis]
MDYAHVRLNAEHNVDAIDYRIREYVCVRTCTDQSAALAHAHPDWREHWQPIAAPAGLASTHKRAISAYNAHLNHVSVDDSSRAG